MAQIIGALWVFPSIHWVFAALLAVLVTTFAPTASRLVLFLAAAVLAADAALLLYYVGPFLGEAMLGAVALAYGFAGWLSRSS